jgi:uncharacterized membrane protein
LHGALLAILFACFAGRKGAAKRRRELEAAIGSQGAHVLDTTVVQVDKKRRVRVYDPQRVVIGAVVSALTWGVFGLLTGGLASLLISAAIGAAWGGWMARSKAHHVSGAQLERAGDRLPADSSALLIFAETMRPETLLADVQALQATAASVAVVAEDLAARVLAGSATAAGGAAEGPSLSMVSLRFLAATEPTRRWRSSKRGRCRWMSSSSSTRTTAATAMLSTRRWALVRWPATTCAAGPCSASSLAH